MSNLAYPQTSFDQCIKCHACTAICPVANATLEFGGPKHLGPELTRLVVNQEYINDDRIELCTLCGTCDLTCPENVHVSTLTALLKATHAEQSGTKFRDYMLSHAEWIGMMASTFAPLTNLAMKTKPVRKMMELVLDIPSERQFPVYQFNHFKKNKHKKMATTKRKVAYYVGCYATYNAPLVAEAFVKVLKYNGIEVVTPNQKCCGVPMFANGQMKMGKSNAVYNIEQLLEYVRQGYDVVATCTSCTLALKKEYVAFLQSEDAAVLACHVYDANEYLRLLYAHGELNLDLAYMNDEAAYYSPCHMKSQGIGNPAIDVLELIPGYQIADLGASCCGQCGTFGFKKEKYDVSLTLAEPLVSAVDSSTASYTVTECGMCKNQLDQLTDKPVKHPIEVLLTAYEAFEQNESTNV